MKYKWSGSQQNSLPRSLSCSSLLVRVSAHGKEALKSLATTVPHTYLLCHVTTTRKPAVDAYIMERRRFRNRNSGLSTRVSTDTPHSCVNAVDMLPRTRRGSDEEGPDDTKHISTQTFDVMIASLFDWAVPCHINEIIRAGKQGQEVQVLFCRETGPPRRHGKESDDDSWTVRNQLEIDR
jgi:hypothetical protein